LSLKCINFLKKGKLMNVLCFQSVAELATEEIIKKINSHKGFKIAPSITLRDKAKISLGKARVKTLRQCTKQELTYKKKPNIKLCLETGVFLVGEGVYNQRDLYIYYENKDADEVKKLVGQLVIALPLVLIEPDLETRIQQLQGCYYPDKAAVYRDGTLWGPIWAHVSWLIYAVNGAWSRYLDNPLDKRLLRQLRVRLRWLRALLSLFRPTLKASECKLWQQKLRASGLDLGALRELDVMILSLEKLQQNAEEGQVPSDKLYKYFAKHKTLKLQKLRKSVKLSQKTLELTSLVLWLQSQPVVPKHLNADFDKIVIKRLRKWSKNIIASTTSNQMLEDMKKAHAVRIRIKKMRYVLLSLAEFGHGNEKILHILKKLQDILGIMHDDYVNGQLVKKLKTTGGKLQREEVLLFIGWESARVESSLTQLEELWQQFGEELTAWKKRLEK